MVSISSCLARGEQYKLSHGEQYKLPWCLPLNATSFKFWCYIIFIFIIFIIIVIIIIITTTAAATTNTTAITTIDSSSSILPRPTARADDVAACSQALEGGRGATPQLVVDLVADPRSDATATDPRTDATATAGSLSDSGAAAVAGRRPFPGLYLTGGFVEEPFIGAVGRADRGGRGDVCVCGGGEGY